MPLYEAHVVNIFSLPYFYLIFHYFSIIKNAKKHGKGDFDQHLERTASKRWSKYNTNTIARDSFAYYKDFLQLANDDIKLSL